MEAVNRWELEVDSDFERAEDEIKRNQESDDTSHPFHNQDRRTNWVGICRQDGGG